MNRSIFITTRLFFNTKSAFLQNYKRTYINRSKFIEIFVLNLCNV